MEMTLRVECPNCARVLCTRDSITDSEPQLIRENLRISRIRTRAMRQLGAGGRRGRSTSALPLAPQPPLPSLCEQQPALPPYCTARLGSRAPDSSCFLLLYGPARLLRGCTRLLRGRCCGGSLCSLLFYLRRLPERRQARITGQKPFYCALLPPAHRRTRGGGLRDVLLVQERGANC